MKKLLLKQILSYEQFFGEKEPDNRLELIKKIPKDILILEIAGLNYRLKPKNRLKYDTSQKSQIDNLRYFCPIDDNLFDKYYKVYQAYTLPGNNYPIIFNRFANLFALEEIISKIESSDNNDDFTMQRTEVWDSILRYLLAVNTVVVKVKPIDSDGLTMENIAASSLVLNELMIEENPFFSIFFGLKLVEFLNNSVVLKTYISNYFQDFVKSDSDTFFYDIFSLVYGNESGNIFTDHVYSLKQPDNLLDYLSSRKIETKEISKLLNIKKSPFYKIDKNRYVLLDSGFLLTKASISLINDLWFDVVKPASENNAPINIKRYKGEIGIFFENYISHILANSFHFLKHPIPLFLNDLKVSISGTSIEVADLYIRQNKKILIGQIKSGSLYDNEKYSGEIDVLYKNNRTKFFEDFGIQQLLDSIKHVLKYYNKFDPSLPANKKITFYPVLIVLEKAFQTILFSNLFKLRFAELVKELTIKNHNIKSLAIIHLSDVEIFKEFSFK